MEENKLLNFKRKLLFEINTAIMSNTRHLHGYSLGKGTVKDGDR